ALAQLGMDAIVQDAGLNAEAEARAQTALGPTSMGWNREQLFGPAGADEDTVQLTQSLELSGRAGQRALALRATGAAARHAAEAVRHTHTAHLRTTFHKARFARERTEVFESWRAQLADAEGRVSARVRAGAAPAWASQHSHHELARGEIIVAQGSAERDGLVAELLSLLAWPEGAEAPRLIAPDMPQLMEGGVDAYTSRLNEHPTTLMYTARARSGDLRRAAGRRAWVPDLEVSLGFKTAAQAATRELGYTAGAQLSLPLGGDRSGDEGVGLAQRTRATHDLRLWTHHQEARVRRAYIRAERLIAVAQKAEAHLSHGHEKLLAAAKHAYDGGELDLGGLLEAHADARDDRLQALELRGQAWLAVIELDHLVGHTP
ncbi:MAG: TolC family protein, partial [Myxococcota bacterium]